MPFKGELHQMEQILPGIWTWKWYSEEKGMNFNGHFIEKGVQNVLIDPPILSAESLEFLRQRGVTDILLTNRDHIRESVFIRETFKAKVWVPSADADEMRMIPIDHRFKDGDLLPGGLKVVSLSDGKSSGESALYINESGGIIILGDALIGKPAGRLNLLPPEKYVDFQKAKSGLRRLLNFSFDIVLVGDGTSFLKEGRQAVEAVLK
jgi:glyoxylase-like metal-dependent hydrolase (beta-lactamase superfamily II)